MQFRLRGISIQIQIQPSVLLWIEPRFCGCQHHWGMRGSDYL